MSILTAIHQPNFLPWLGYFAKIALSENFVFLDTVQFSKGSYTNRVRILGQDGRPKWLTVPIQRSGLSQKKIQDVSIVEDKDWTSPMLSSIRFSYRRAPYLGIVSDWLETELKVPESYIADLNIRLIGSLSKQLSLNTKFIRASELKADANDPSQRLALLCQEVDSKTYLSGHGANNYQEVSEFHKHGIEVIQYKFEHPRYTQFSEEFVPGLSILDTCLFLGFERTTSLLREFYTSIDLQYISH